MKLRSLLALLLVAAFGAVAASTALATTPRDGEAAEDVAPGVATPQAAGHARVSASTAECSSGARTLSRFGDRLYPDMGNGGYTSVHTDVYLMYDAPTNMFLPGTHVHLTQRATQCLTDFSLDFERTNANVNGPNMSVNAVTVNGQPATFRFVQPTYPGNPNGQDDPDPLAHAVSNSNPVSATNPNPPACSPQVSGNSQNGTQCPANKLVITPSAPIPEGATFLVRVDYTGRPGVHVDGDGSTEGWFRVNTAAAPNDGSFVTTEPVGSAAWMPLNNHPSAKPTYDVYDTVNVGKVAIGPGELEGAVLGPTFAPVGPTSVNPPDANFPGGSWTWHWHSPEPIASYLVTNCIGSYDLVARKSAISGIDYYQALASGLTPARKATIKANLDQQEDFTTFLETFSGPYPFTTAGIIVALPSVGFAEEMQTKITFGNGATSTPSIGTINHEIMHQWFGDNVAEASFNLTFWKEGFATLGEYLNTARGAANAAGGIGTPNGDAAFETSLVNRFNTNYNTTSSTFWTSAPSNPTVGNLFSTASTYTRPGTAYLALWRILGRERMIETMKRIQVRYRGGTINQEQLEGEFHESLPNQSPACHARLDEFFTQWFDTPYPAGGGANKPQITGPGLSGPGFTCAPTVDYTLTPPAPTGNAGWYTGDVALTWQVDNGLDATTATTGCIDRTFPDGTFSESCSATNTVGSAGPVVVNVNRDATAPETTASLQPTAIGEWYSPRTVTLSADDGTSGVESTSYRVDGGPWTPYSGSFFVGTSGPHTLEYRSTDVAGNVEATKTTTWGADFPAADQLAGLYDFVGGLGLDKGLTKQLQHHLSEAGKKLGKPRQPCGQLDEFLKHVMDQAGKKDPRLTFAQALQLLSANQIEVLLGCIAPDSTRPAAESKTLALMEAIDRLDVAKPVGDELGNRAREIGKQIAVGDRHACHSLAELSKKMADLQARGKLSAAQAAELTDAVAAIERDVGC